MTLPQAYQWLEKESGFIMIMQALELYDDSEPSPGGNNPLMMPWSNEIKGHIPTVTLVNGIPWSCLLMCLIVKRSGFHIVRDALSALSWSQFGNPSELPMLGDVLVFESVSRSKYTTGHVGLYVAEDSECFHVLGGYKSDKVCITRIEKKRFVAARRPPYKVPPENMRMIFMEGE